MKLLGLLWYFLNFHDFFLTIVFYCSIFSILLFDLSFPWKTNYIDYNNNK